MLENNCKSEAEQAQSRDAKNIESQIKAIEQQTEEAVSVPLAFARGDLVEMRHFWKDDPEISAALEKTEISINAWIKETNHQANEKTNELRSELRKLKSES
jgi:hypothetical protein